MKRTSPKGDNMYRRITLSLVALVVALISPGLAHADMVTQWNQNAATVLMGNLGQGPALSVPHLAMVHGAAASYAVSSPRRSISSSTPSTPSRCLRSRTAHRRRAGSRSARLRGRR